MDKSVIQNIIIESQEYIPQIELVKRDFFFEPNGSYVFVGVRQAGKSYLLYQRMQELISGGEPLERMLYINFDDERLKQIKAEDLDLILQAYKLLFKHKPILFFDEIQNVDGWENFARRLANQKYIVYITGSNAKMLSRDIATTLGGRYWQQWVYPFSFLEFLQARGLELKSNFLLGNQGLEINRLFDEYFKFGGFPELISVVNKRIWLNDIYNKIFFADLASRNNVRNEDALRLMVHKLAESVKQATPYNRITNLIKSVGVPVGTGTIIEFARYLNESCLMFSLDNYESKFVEKEGAKKHYFIDNGLLNIFLTDSPTSLLENICAIHLFKKYPNSDGQKRLYYYQSRVECDFYVPEINTAIQVSYSIEDDLTYKREVDALKKLDERYPLDRMLIVTRDQERIIDLGNGKSIEVVPVWKWLCLCSL